MPLSTYSLHSGLWPGGARPVCVKVKLCGNTHHTVSWPTQDVELKLSLQQERGDAFDFAE